MFLVCECFTPFMSIEGIITRLRHRHVENLGYVNDGKRCLLCYVMLCISINISGAKPNSLLQHTHNQNGIILINS